MVDRETALGHDLLEITIGERVSQIPTDTQENDDILEMPPSKQCWPFSDHRYTLPNPLATFATQPFQPFLALVSALPSRGFRARDAAFAAVDEFDLPAHRVRKVGFLRGPHRTVVFRQAVSVQGRGKFLDALLQLAFRYVAGLLTDERQAGPVHPILPEPRDK